MRYFSFENSNHIDVTACGQLVSRADFLHQRRCFDENVLILVTRGTLYIAVNGEKRTLSRGDYIVLRANEWHEGVKKSEDALTYMWMHFLNDLSIADKSADIASSITIPECGRVGNEGYAFQNFLQLLDVFVDDTDYGKSLRAKRSSTVALLLFMEIMRAISTVERSDNSMVPIVQWIHRNYHSEFTVADLGDMFGYQHDYLSNKFKKIMGVSISSYTNRVRINAAKQLINSYDLTISEVAYSCGFSDEKYFMRVFKKYESMTPTQYRKSCGSKYINYS